MATRTIVSEMIGIIPVEKGAYNPGTSYAEGNKVTLYNCEFESKHDQNNTAPASLNTTTGVITFNTDHWKVLQDGRSQWLIDNGYKKVDASNVKDGDDTQHDINAGVASTLQAHETALDNRYTKSETYSKDEVNGLITTPEQGFVSVEATDSTTSVTDVLPATGEADTIYRVGNWDGTQYDDTVYSEYAWDGTNYVHLSKKTQIGEVYDISAAHSGQTYADLAAALDGGNNVPEGIRKGGMSIKFVQTSDNKYVQYFLTKTSWSADVGDWDKINLYDEVCGRIIVSYSGAEGFVNISSIGADTDVVIELSGGIDNLRFIKFLHDWSVLSSIVPEGRARINTKIPATCNKIGFYEVSGTTLSFTAIIKTGNLLDNVAVVEEKIEQLPFPNGILVEGQLSPDETNLLSSIKSVGYYSPVADIMFIRMFGFFGTFVQMTLTPDKTTMFDFKEDVSTRPSGIKNYHLFNGEKELLLTFDWDEFNNDYVSNSNYRLQIQNPLYSYIIAPLDKHLQEEIDAEKPKEETIGFAGETYEQPVANSVICPVKKTLRDGKIKSIYLKSQNAGKVTIYIGEVDQLYLFVTRTSFEINVSVGEQTIDVSNLNIYVFAGEQVALKCNGNRYYYISDGIQEDSFYYGESWSGMQLKEYDVSGKKIQFAFEVTIQSSDVLALSTQVEENKKAIQALNAEMSYVKSNLNIISDISGTKYRMMVVNGDVKAFSLNFSHIIAVGNSYTMHPTTTDTGDLATSVWWGHWAMAASRKETAWTTLLQSALRQKDNSAKVTPVFGRRYETGLRALSDNDAFIYWEDNQWKNLKSNVSNFSDVDCVLFFLGDNYTVGSGWYEIYKPMVLQFISWFPNATIICCSCRIREANNSAIAQVANEVSAVYVSMYGLTGASKLGNYVSGDDENLHQIDNSAVAGHFGDYGEWLILDRIVQAIGYENNATLYNISITNPTGVTLSVENSQTVEGAIVSVFADIAEGASLSEITVISEGDTVAVTDHGVTAYGRIFTFQMPGGDVSITGY